MNSKGYLFGFGVVAFFVLVPLNWARKWTSGELSFGGYIEGFALPTLVSWAGAAGLTYALLKYRDRQRAGAKERELAIQAIFDAPLRPTTTRAAILKKDELAYAVAQGRLQEIKTVGYSGRSQGVSIRIAKGLSYRTGGSRGQPIQGGVIVSTGELVVTSRRVLFAGDRKSFSLDIADLVRVTPYTDGIGLSSENKTFTVLIADQLEIARVRAALYKLLDQLESGEEA